MATVSEFIAEWENGLPYVKAHTSGSTGKPKEIKLLKSDMATSAKATNKFFGITERSVLGVPLSMDYIAGKMMCVRAIVSGAKLIEMPVSNVVIIDRHYDLLAVVPSQVDSLLDQKAVAENIGALIIGGAALSDKRKGALISKGIRTYVTYGMTETCSHVALHDISDGEDVYRALPGITFDVDARSCLAIRSDNMSFGRLTTNDMVRLIDERTFTWLGRYDNMINSGGIKIAAEELESILSEYIDVPFCITARIDEKWGEAPVLVFEGEKANEESIVAKIRQINGLRVRPKTALAVKELPKTANGKLDRKKIRSLIC